MPSYQKQKQELLELIAHDEEQIRVGKELLELHSEDVPEILLMLTQITIEGLTERLARSKQELKNLIPDMRSLN